MATNTKKLNLKKPAQEDFYNIDDFNDNFQKIDDFAKRQDNPHNVTKAQLGLDKVDNTSDADKPISNATQLALNDKSPTNHKHSASDLTSGTISTDRLPVIPIAKGGTGATTKTEAANLLGVATLLGGTELPSGTDLNTILTAGNYYCPTTATVTDTFVNCPSGYAFTMKVFYASGISSYITQEVISLVGQIYHRYYDVFSKKWSSWVETITTSNIDDYANAKIATGTYVGTGSHYSSRSLTFNFKPKLVIIGAPSPASEGWSWQGGILTIEGNINSYYKGGTLSGTFNNELIENSNGTFTFKWRVSDGSNGVPWNDTAYTYPYIAIG